MATLTEKLTETLGLDAGAPEEKILEAVTGVLSERDTLKEQADKTESLEDRAKAEGKVVIESDQLNDLKGRLEATEKSLADTEFDRAFETALNEQRVDAKDETRQRFHTLFEKDRETTLDLLKNSPRLVNSEAKGKGGSEEVADAPEGVDPDSHALDREVRAFMAEHSEDSYTVALDKVLATKEATL